MRRCAFKAMQIIPVIDLKQGEVVHARMGERDRYAPIRSPLAAGSAPVDIVAGLLRLHPFHALYAADLDAIAGTGDNGAALAAIRAAFPALSLWLDAGFAQAGACRAWLESGPGMLVLGSEAQRDERLLGELLHARGADRVILSLDFRGESFVGPPALLERPALWPERVIVMTLARVGSSAGPDLDRLAALQARAPDRRFFAAGGVRGPEDLAALRQLKAAGVLVASALHDGRLGPAELQ
jgi:phosphoribosylformimino-5-aminoimidazole carboxamide ribotide isomerase